MKVVIVGGSVSGLMHGVMLKHHGHSVHIFERMPRDLEAQGAGVSTANEVTAFLSAHDRLASPLSLPSNGVRIFDPTTTLVASYKNSMQMCTWDAMYYRLRANFDQLASSYCPTPPSNLSTDGSAVYDIGKEVIGVEAEDPTGSITIRYRDRLGDGDVVGIVTADIVIAADGASSTVKTLLAPHAPPRQYAGYVAWRGIVPESAVSEAARNLLFGSFTFHTASDEYAVVYPIPGKSGSLAEGERALNFVWYSWIPATELAEYLTDSDGHTHRWAVPSGKLRKDMWERQRDHGVAALTEEFGEMLKATELPFVQVVTDCASPSQPGPTFYGGRVFLVGDAQCVIRPHTGFALNQAARHCREIETRLPQIKALVRAGEKEEGGRSNSGGNEMVEDWNQVVLEFGHVARLRSIAFGMLYLKPRLRWLPAALRWKAAEAWIAIKSLWRTRVLRYSR